MATQETDWLRLVRDSSQYRPGFTRKYRLTEHELGRGDFGVVHLGEVLNSDIRRAVKVVSIDHLDRDHANLSKLQRDVYFGCKAKRYVCCFVF